MSSAIAGQSSSKLEWYFFFSELRHPRIALAMRTFKYYFLETCRRVSTYTQDPGS
jgi:hypothetical protein